MILTGFFTLILCLSSGSAEKADTWVPQYGTVLYPKDPQISSEVHIGDIYQHKGKFLWAKQDCNLQEEQHCWNFPKDSEGETNVWKPLQKGTYLLPKIFGEDVYHDTGDIFRDKDTGTYYHSPQKGIIHQVTEAAQQGWEVMNEKADWMTNLRPIIGDRRMGDIITPGTHDTGTVGCNENSFLVDTNFLFEVAELLDGQILANWSKTQTGDLGQQLEAGFRSFDVRIADMEVEDGTFRWWHGITGDIIEDDLRRLANFSQNHPEEVIILSFAFFAAPGNTSNTEPIPERRKDIISDILLETIGSYLAPRTLGDNPTMNEVLATGRNIICIMKDSYIQQFDVGYWSGVRRGSWSGRTNPEALFEQRSGSLKNYREQYQNHMTELSGCVTPTELIITPGLIRVFGDDEFIREIIAIIAPELLEVQPDFMSFEGMFTDLVTLGGMGVNEKGMYVRIPEYYTSGASVHYRGMDEMFRYWLARPGVYKVNEVHIDDYAHSTIVDTSIVANRGEVKREVTIAFQGSPLHGYYRWGAMHAEDGDLGLQCDMIEVRYTVTSMEYQLREQGVLAEPDTVTFTEGQYPNDASVTVEVTSPEAASWVQIYAHNIRSMIITEEDLYIRGTDLGSGRGMAYASLQYNLFGNDCINPPDADVNVVTW